MAPTPRATWQVYLVACRDGSLYTGCTNDLARRVRAHNAGTGARYTRSRRPVRVAWTRRVKDRSTALSLEARLKRLTRREKLALVAGALRVASSGPARRRPRPAGPAPRPRRSRSSGRR